MPEPTLYLFDGSNLLHAGGFADRDQVVDVLASFVASAVRVASSCSTATVRSR